MSSTPIYDALAQQILGSLTDFTPHWPSTAHAEPLRPSDETRARRGPLTENNSLEELRRLSPQPARHRRD